MLDKSAQAGQHSHAERSVDLYETPVCAVEALRKVERLPNYIWEPACGPGAIVRVFRAYEHTVYASDIKNYSWNHKVKDFLTAKKAPKGCDAIVTNPPFQFAEQFVRHALEVSPLVIMLLRFNFYESQRRTDILDNGNLSRIHVFSNRLPMMHRFGWDGPRASSAMPFAWYVWERWRKGPTTIDRISWEK
jgi:hypothetical protein